MERQRNLFSLSPHSAIRFFMKLRSLTLALLLALSISGVVFAHADLARSDPAANAVLDVAPAQVTIEFTEPVEPRLSKIEVLYDDGSVADNNDTPRDPADPKVLPVFPERVARRNVHRPWRALSEVDGHVTSDRMYSRWASRSIGRKPAPPAQAR